MFKKVLISDDYSSINQGVLAVLEEAGIHNIKQVQYCDDAYLEIKSAILKQEPYDLFITDLNFKTDHRKQKYASGEALSAQLKKEYPDFPIIVYSVEDRLQKVRYLINSVKVNAFVCKGRDGLKDLSSAIHAVDQHDIFLSSYVQQALNSRNNLEINDYDIELLSLLASGQSKEAISNHFKSAGFSPSGLSSIEKKQAKLQIQFGANNAIHLISIVKDLGLI
ncbi:DNA-binding NarL/FixJ family response regulator [Nonlabens dokdonensis]|uniref:DNA-binding NarL/FixJ family response regulator n=2 Tax=Nonlabens dokdonensis TaxID=328515 RepID=A0ABX5Q0P6_9FLAO|nr:response regulator transcription factor [Nonlabens dokdonensis]AGC75950.1 putative fimbrial protein Z, transcriptional regulator (LuxR/UhpA family) [Nonlabens dokdonensis DSW-6]PZX43627.1 DNA-binding NarL/FixJ family response regulator [Nonlabens dokdonensis]